ncbi:MAG: UvrB/UvrC motif-containing protein [Bacteroidetes bacterium]|nr:UvrB/UvrC motif-containing protein [Bacteroidota bacterium]
MFTENYELVSPVVKYLEFEKAASLRDEIAKLEKLLT